MNISLQSSQTWWSFNYTAQKTIKGTLGQYITTQSQANFTIISHFC